MTDRESARLRGRVKTCSVETDYVYPAEHWVMQTQDSFSPEGCLLERRHRNPDGSEWSHVYRYDPPGRLVEKVNTNSAGVERFQYWYDPLGRLERIMLHRPAADERVFESRKYGVDGTQNVTTYLLLDETKRRTAGASAGAALHFSADAATILTILDALERPTRKILYDEDERVIRRICFRYDERGLLLEEGESINGRIRDDFRNSYQYDSWGRRIAVVQRWESIHTEQRAFAYNERGDVILEEIRQDSGLILTGDSGSQMWIERFTYRYDDRDNWLERTTQTLLQSGETRVSMVERRELTYC